METTLAVSRPVATVPFEKTISMALTALALVLLTPLAIQEAIIVFGQGHFLACYYYQYKYGQITKAYLIKYLLATVLIFGGYILYPNLYLLVTAASVYFVVHLSADERFLWKDKPNIQRGLAFFPFVAVYSGMIVDSIFVGTYRFVTGVMPPQVFQVPLLGAWITPYCLLVAALGFVAYLAYIRLQPARMETHDVYFLLAAAVLAALYAVGKVPNHFYLMGAVILFHYSSWYLHYYVRWKDDKPRRNRYILDMLVINAIVFGLYAFYRFLPNALNLPYVPEQIFPFKTLTHGNGLAYLFSPGYFYLWTFMHYVTTLRFSDLGYFGRSPARG